MRHRKVGAETLRVPLLVTKKEDKVVHDRIR